MGQRETATVVDVREASEVDAADVGAFIRTAWREAGPDGPGFAGATDATIDALADPAALRERIRGAGRHLFLATCDGRFVGFAATRALDTATVELAGIVVARDAAGMGIGTRLVALAVEVTRGDGMARMIVRTETTNERAIAFYRHVGFTPVGTLLEHVEDTDVEVIELSMAL